MDNIRVFIADDHELVRYALRTLLEAESDIEVVGEAADTQSAIDGCIAAAAEGVAAGNPAAEVDGRDMAR